MALFWRSRTTTWVALFLESCSLYIVLAVVASLVKFEQLHMPFWLVLGALMWGYVLSLWILGLRVTPVLRGLLGLALGVPSLLVLTAWNAGEALLPFVLLTSGGIAGVGLFIGSMIFLVVVWWRGVSLSQEDVTLDIVRSAFQVGLVVLLVASLIDSATPGRIVSGFLVVGFFAVGLPGMALARFSSETGEEREMPAQWLWPIAICVGGVLVLGLLVSALGLGGLDDVTRVVTSAVAAVGYWLLEPVLLLIGLLAGALVNVGNWFSERMGGGGLEGLIEAQRRIDEFHQSLREAESEPGNNILFAVLQWGAAAAGSVALVGVVYALFRSRRRRGRDGNAVESRESLFTLKHAGEDLGEALGGLLGGFRLRRRGRRGNAPRSPREYYHALLELASGAGRSRDSWETPREHQRGLSGVLPADPVANIVEEFQDSHYGAAAETETRLESLEASHSQLEEFMKERLKDK